MHTRRIAITTIADDLHALLVERRLQELGHDCHIIEVDRLSGCSTLNWTNTGEGAAELPTRSGGAVDVRSLDVIWWRRTQRDQRLPWALEGPAQIDLVNNDCRAALLGTLLTRFHGAWVNDPVRAVFAENKLVQLGAAEAAGFRVPATLVSQDPAEIRSFCRAQGQAIVKPVMGTRKTPLLTRMITDRHLESGDGSLTITPATYQEFIPGNRHLRVQCFGDRMVAVLIDAKALDWRARLDSEMRLWSLSDAIRTRLLEVLRTLGLRMGIVDLKLTDEGECVWLEVNQQGQFLFLEGLTGAPLLEEFCDFLIEEDRHAVIAGACAGQT